MTAVLEVSITNTRPYSATCVAFGRTFSCSSQFSRTEAAKRVERMVRQVVRHLADDLGSKNIIVPDEARRFSFLRVFQ